MYVVEDVSGTERAEQFPMRRDDSGVVLVCPTVQGDTVLPLKTLPRRRQRSLSQAVSRVRPVATVFVRGLRASHTMPWLHLQAKATQADGLCLGLPALPGWLPGWLPGLPVIRIYVARTSDQKIKTKPCLAT